MIPILSWSHSQSSTNVAKNVCLHGTNTDYYYFSSRSSNGSASMGTDLLFIFNLLSSITLELRARLPAGGLRFHFFLCCLVVHDLYRTTTIQKTPFKTVLYYNYPPRVETVQYIRRYYCPFFLPAPRSNPCLARSVPYARYPHKLHGYIYTMIFALRGATRHWGYILM